MTFEASFEPSASVDPGRRFRGVQRLYSSLGAQKIFGAHVVIVGIGGVGSWAAEALARSGVGQLTLIDMDHLAESNVNRQVHAQDETLGQSKVVAMSNRIASFHPSCDVTCIDDFASADNWPGILDGKPFDGLIDACDNIHAKTAMAAWAMRSGTLFIASGAAGGKRLAHKAEIDDLAFTTHDPLLAQMRYRLRKNHGAQRNPEKKMGVTCVFSREAVAKANTGAELQAAGSLNCAGYGSSVAVTANFGFCAAGWMLSALSAMKTNI